MWGLAAVLAAWAVLALVLWCVLAGSDFDEDD